MSLFKARDWWSTQVTQSAEDFDQGCLATGALDPGSPQVHQVVVGSHSGLLRVYAPSRSGGEDEEEVGPRGGRGSADVDCLWLEEDLRSPILQVALGRFVSAVDRNHVAVLQPRRVAVYGLNSTPGSTSHGSQWQLRLVYEHQLQRTAFNLCWGPFGRVSDKDFLCVQSVDGTLSVFEQESFAFSRFLPDALLPGPLAYMSSTDSFVTVSSMRQVESYRYQTLAVATDAKTKEEAQALKSGKRVKADWTFNLGETAQDLQAFGEQFLVVLGRRCLYCLSEAGKLRFMLRLDFPADCLHVYGLRGADQLLLLVASAGGELLVYQNTALRWAARMDRAAVEVRVADLAGLRAAVVALGAGGRLSALYLGTDPAEQSAAAVAAAAAEAREVDYAASDGELAELQRRVRAAAGRAPVPGPGLAGAREGDLRITVELPRGLDDRPAVATALGEAGEAAPTCTAQIRLRPRGPLSGVQLAVDVRPPLAANPARFHFAAVDAGSPAECLVSFFLAAPAPPADLSARLIASYSGPAGPRVAQATFALPLALVAAPAAPEKAAAVKLTLEANRAPADLEALFPELRLPELGAGGGAVAARLRGGGPVVTLLASRSANRYRLQADALEALWPVAGELLTRLRAREGDSFEASFAGPLPLGDFFGVVDEHYEARAGLAELRGLVAQRAEQFRAIQRRLLTRFKDRTPAPLANLDSLLEGSLRQLVQMADLVEEARRRLAATGCALAAATSLLALLLRLSHRLGDEEWAALQAVLSGGVADHEECGMEEQFDAALTHLLRAVLSRAPKDAQLTAAPLTMPKDTQRLKKHINMLCDRLGKGARLAPAAESERDTPSSARPSPAASLAPLAIVQDAGGDQGGLLPMENKFSGFRSPRAADSGEKRRKKKKKRRKANGEVAAGEDDSAFRKFEPTMNEEQLSKLSALRDLDDLISPPTAEPDDAPGSDDEAPRRSHSRYLDTADKDFYG